MEMIFFMGAILAAKLAGTMTWWGATAGRAADGSASRPYQIDTARNLTDINSSNGWLDFKENSRVKKSARAQTACANGAQDQ